MPAPNPTRHPAFVAAVTCLLCAAAFTARAEDKRVVQVVASSASCAAVHDASQLLVFGHQGVPEYQLSVFHLDAKGNVTGDGPQYIVLPRPASMAEHASYALGLAFHPTLPLLYVWQDIQGPKAEDVFAGFDHLIIFEIADGTLAPVGYHGRGPEYGYGQGVGHIALAPSGRGLFLPNLREPANNRAAIGRLALSAEGVPYTGEGEGVPLRVDVANFRGLPTGWGFVAGSDTVVVFRGNSSLATWDSEHRLAGISAVLTRGQWADSWIGGDPRFPAAYAAANGANLLVKMTQVDGYLSMLPQRLSVAGGNFRCPPVVMAKPPLKLAVGGVNALHLVPIDKAGDFTGEPETLALSAPYLRAIAWSDRFNRLYAAVEKLP